MEVKLIKDNEDGSGDFQFDLTQEEIHFLVRWALTEILKRSVQDGKKLSIPSEENQGENNGEV